MFYSRSEAHRIQRCLFFISCAAWAPIIAQALWSGPVQITSICGSGWIPGSTADWMLSASAGWLLMVAAMMTPLNIQPLLHIRISSFSDRRRRSNALFWVGYIAIWLVAGWATKLLELVISRGVQDESFLVGVTALTAGLWQVSPLKQRCLNQCHFHRPLSAFGLAADMDALRFGLDHGFWCMGSCWALMLFADSLSQWHIEGMALVALLMYCERMDPPTTPGWKLRGVRTAALRLRRTACLNAPGWLAPLLKRSQ